MLNVIVGCIECLGSRLSILAVGESVPQREHAPTGMVAGIEHNDLVAGLEQLVGRRESRQPCADDQDAFARAACAKGCGGKERGLEEIAPAEIHEETVGALTGAGGKGFFFAAGRNAQHQIATLVR